MKRVMLRDRGQYKAREVVLTIAENPPPGVGISVPDMRKRNRIIDELERQKDTPWVDLEDADHDYLVALTNAFQFATAKPDLLRVLDEILNARTPEESPSLKVVEGDAG